MKYTKFSYLGLIGIIFILINGYINLNTYPGIFFTLTNISIICILIFKIFFIKKNISIKSIIYIFLLFFFGLSPIYQLNNNFYIWGTYLTKEEVIISNLTILLILLLLEIFSRPIFKKKYPDLQRISNNDNLNLIKIANSIEIDMSFRKQFLLLIISFSLFILFFYSYSFNYFNLIYRINDSEDGFNGGVIFYLFISYIIRPLIFNIFIIFIFCKNKSNLIFTLLFILAIISVFPTGVPRFFSATMYLTLFYLIFLKYYKKNISLLFILSFGLIFIFPFFDFFRWAAVGNELSNYIFNLDLASGNFDAFGMFSLALNRGTIVLGKNIISAFLFYIPRSLWPGKEIGSGAKISGELDLELDNISMPYFAEGYLAFGIFGLISLTIFIAFYSTKIDNKIYYLIKYYDKSFNPIFLIFYFNLVFLIFFIMRGDLMSSFAYLCGISFSNYILYKLTRSSYKTRYDI
jgi:hypothetical protein